MKRNYQYEKRQRELEKKKKREEKALRKAAARQTGENPEGTDTADIDEGVDGEDGEGTHLSSTVTDEDNRVEEQPLLRE